MKSRDSHDDRDSALLNQQAAHWWIVLNEDQCTADDREQFANWVRRSPERIEAFLRVSVLSHALRSGQIRWPDTPAEELIRQARSAPAEVIPVLRSVQVGATAQPRDPSTRRSALMLLAASMATLFVAALFFWIREAPQHYRTALGEQRSVLLEDGSVVTLNTLSEIQVAYDKQRRYIRLVSGEALFNVAHDAERTFDVAAGSVIVRAVGTQFNVDQRADRTTVTVVEGKVRVSANMSGPPGEAPGSAEPPLDVFEEVVTASQRVVVTPAGMSPLEQVPDVAPVTAWTQRQLVFEDRPLSEVAAEFNRYNRHHILIADPALRGKRVTGVFQANDSDSFLAFISGIPGVSVRADAAGHHLVYRNDRAEKVGVGGGPNQADHSLR